ncbi:uncharacterized protein LOC129723129 isoform X2 [Wyeomyia smithii]|uniref:uncharacterized protein LOC129723129 isoform X2 n=1 Tax=Wyeomyia smithii TaxID=174621 RepID=UPI002468181D|nr:uncharacterized protein LOC129723129 isoform X2 [Wyeomyia smithii]
MDDSYEDEEHLEEKDVIRSSPPTSAREESLFSFKGIFYQRLFRSQLRPKEVAKQDIGGDTMHDVLFSIWQKVEKYDKEKKKKYSVTDLKHRSLPKRRGKPPPVELAKYFRWKTVSEAARLQAVHRGMVVANTINEGWMQGIADVKSDLRLACEILQNAIQKVEAMQSRGLYGTEICSTLETAMRPESRDPEELQVILTYHFEGF